MKSIFARAFMVASFLSATIGYAQTNGFAYGHILYTDMNMTTYERDTSAAAAVLDEFGYAFIDLNTYKLIFEHHQKIKILKKDGLSQADFTIPLRKTSSTRMEYLRELKASTWNLENNRIEETKLDPKKVYTENYSKYWDLKKFALPNVREGSVIEVYYRIESPYVFNFRRWEFQSDIPKVNSEYWTEIPGNYNYNITLKGFLKLSKNESKIKPNCITLASASADCAFSKYAMQHVPAFVEEDYMTAKKNFIASINYELSTINYFDGRVDKITKEWKDAEQELKKHSSFGVQLKKGKDISQKLQELLAGVTDPKEKAVRVYNFIKSWYEWNGIYDYFCDVGIKKAFDSRKGNIGDINLSLIAALDNAGLNVEPMLLSTRGNGHVNDLHPVLSDFDYVVAKLNLNDKVYLLDATDPFLMFGMLPERCFNGKGRVFGEKESYWYELKPQHSSKGLTILDLTLEPSGSFTGTMQHFYDGYKSVEHRKRVASFTSTDEYLADVRKHLDRVTITKHEISGIEDPESSIKETFTVEIEGFDDLNTSNLLLNPFFTGKIEKNPFRSSARLYPVDFGIPVENTIVLNLTHPEEFELVSKPEGQALTLPHAGGRFLFDVKPIGHKLTMSYSLVISKTLYSSAEYHYLKELYSRIIQAQNADLVFKKKT
jgi:hypothetical protein